MKVAKYLQCQRESPTNLYGISRLVVRRNILTKSTAFLMFRHDLQTRWNNAGLLVIGKFIPTAAVYCSRWFETTDNDCNDEGMNVSHKNYIMMVDYCDGWSAAINTHKFVTLSRMQLSRRNITVHC